MSTGEDARKAARQVEQNIHGLCPGHPIADGPAATCGHCNMSRLTLEELVWHTLRPGETRSTESVGVSRGHEPEARGAGVDEAAPSAGADDCEFCDWHKGEAPEPVTCLLHKCPRVLKPMARDLCDRLEDEGRKTYGEWTPTHVRQLMREAATEISRLRDENARHRARQELFLSELTVLREERVDTKGPWSGVWNNWIAPYHACPCCGKSLNWVQGEDVFDRPMISTNCCGVIHQAKLLWPHESTVAADRRAQTGGRAMSEKRPTVTAFTSQDYGEGSVTRVPVERRVCERRVEEAIVGAGVDGTTTHLRLRSDVRRIAVNERSGQDRRGRRKGERRRGGTHFGRILKEAIPVRRSGTDRRAPTKDELPCLHRDCRCCQSWRMEMGRRAVKDGPLNLRDRVAGVIGAMTMSYQAEVTAGVVLCVIAGEIEAGAYDGMTEIGTWLRAKAEEK